VTRSLGERARGAEHGEAEVVMCSIEMEKEHNNSLGGREAPPLGNGGRGHGGFKFVS
jgi:hypothetical protein